MTANPLALIDDDHPLDLVHDAWRGMTDTERDQFNRYLVAALSVVLTSDQVASGIAAARDCCHQIEAGRS